MEKTIGGSDEKFMHGDVFTVAKIEPTIIENGRYARKKDLKVVRPKSKFRVNLEKLIAAGTISISVYFSPVNLPDVASNVGVYKIWDFEEIGSRLKKARTYIGLSREKAGEILFVSPGAIQTVEESSVKSPSLENMVTYNKFANLVGIYENFFKEDRKAAKFFFQMPSHGFGNVSPFDFIRENGPEAIDKVASIHSLTLA